MGSELVFTVNLYIKPHLKTVIRFPGVKKFVLKFVDRGCIFFRKAKTNSAFNFRLIFWTFLMSFGSWSRKQNLIKLVVKLNIEFFLLNIQVNKLN